MSGRGLGQTGHFGAVQINGRRMIAGKGGAALGLAHADRRAKAGALGIASDQGLGEDDQPRALGAACRKVAAAFSAVAMGSHGKDPIWATATLTMAYSFGVELMTGWRKRPMPSTQASTTSPGQSHSCGVRPAPTPSGVPEAMMSPGSSVMP